MPPDRREELLLVDIVDRADAVAAALARFEGQDLDDLRTRPGGETVVASRPGDG